MGKRPSNKFWLVHAISLLVVLTVWMASCSRRAEQGEADDGGTRRPTAAAGSPGPAEPTAPSLANGAPTGPMASASAGAAAGSAAPADSAEPIDLAIAPDGGVPYQAEGTQLRSPFAKPNAGQSVRIKVGFLLNSVDDYDVKTGTFTADFFLSLTSARPMPSIRLASPNGKIDSVETLADKPTFKLYRYAGSFKSPPDLRTYPFDSQELRIVLEDDLRGTDQIRLVPDKERTQLARGFRALGWQVDYVEARALSQSYPDRFEGDDLYYGRYIFAVGLERYATSAAFKVFVPAFVIVIIALLGMWVPPSEMEVRANSGAPMLAGAVLFHFALMQELPATSYLTRADKLMMSVYFSLAIGMISTWFMFLVPESKVAVVFRWSRIVVPVVTAVAMAFGCLY